MVNLRAMTPQDLDSCVALTQEVKWPHRLADWQQMLQLGEGVVAEQQGRVVGTTLFWRWGTERASLGVIVVAGALRGQGIGKALLQHTLQQLDGWQLHLHATAAGAPLYRQMGFVAAGEVIQYQTPALTPPSVNQPAQEAQPGDLPALAQLDWQANGFQRLALLQQLWHSGARITLLRQQNEPLGFAVTRRFGHGYVIGPVIAPDSHTAQQLIVDAMQPLAGAFVRIDSRSEAGLGAWLQAVGLQPVDNPLRMVRGSDWQPQRMTAWSLMSQAMG
ncbi:putative N-acetyltransferase YhbS [Pantoea alhagi]|uniref:GNAT family N-acetyltransferase n=1 Tax=Mixta sp. BE291 TaxID=3158787 RepID=UPI00285EBCE9|nr:putative N-acetyltransferase YhbS [Pantoea alhagi]